MPAKDSIAMNNGSFFLKRALAAIVVLLLFSGEYFQTLAFLLHPERIKAVLEKAGIFAPLILMILMALAVIITFLPSVPLDIAAGAFFGPVLGTAYCAAGALGGAVAAFLISRYYGREFVSRHLSGHINFCTPCSDLLLTKFIFVSRLLPMVSFSFVSYGAGLTKMSVRAYSLATLGGMLPMTFAYNYFGSPILAAPRGMVVVLGGIMVALLFLFPRLIERYDLFSLRKYFQHEAGA
jgi:uncharacterized membrane protein YdjX (TVP38/TMEM64 family)